MLSARIEQDFGQKAKYLPFTSANEGARAAESIEWLVKGYVAGPTALYDAVYYGRQLLKNSSSADLLFVFSDGDDNKSSLNLEALERILIGSGVRFFAVRIRDLTNLSSARRLDEMGSPRALAAKKPALSRSTEKNSCHRRVPHIRLP
jgi:hypothetical protein